MKLYSITRISNRFIDTIEISRVEAKPSHQQNVEFSLFEVATKERVYQLMGENEEDMDRYPDRLDQNRRFCKSYKSGARHIRQ